MDNEFLLFDRIQKIKQVISIYGEKNFYIAFSGGKDSTVLSALIDMAIPDNEIPRVYVNTGIDLNMIRDFVFEMGKSDSRVNIITPSKSVKKMLETEGYPFKSKIHSHVIDLFQSKSSNKMIDGYRGNRPEQWHCNTCPKILEYQFSDDFKLKVSDKCCLRMKEEPLIDYANNNKKSIAIIGTMRVEGGRRTKINCLQFKGKKLSKFQPLAPMTKEWEEWFINEYNVQICDIYKPPYNFTRTGCKGCPFALHLQNELDTLEKFFPAERKQCEYIWQPVYDEYRRIGYRLKKKGG